MSHHTVTCHTILCTYTIYRILYALDHSISHARYDAIPCHNMLCYTTMCYAPFGDNVLSCDSTSLFHNVLHYIKCTIPAYALYTLYLLLTIYCILHTRYYILYTVLSCTLYIEHSTTVSILFATYSVTMWSTLYHTM